MGKRCVATLFDFNGVLIDDEHVHLAAFRDVLVTRGITVTDEAYQERYLGFDDAGALRAILIDAGHTPSQAEIDALIEAKKPAYMARIAAALRIFPNAVELVRRRARRGPVAIVSGALAHEIEYALGKMDLRDAVAFVISANDVREGKPHPAGYRLARSELARLFPSAASAVAVEDSRSGVEAAKAAGLRCAAVTHSYSAEQLAQAGADVVVGSLAELSDEWLDGPFE